MPQSAPVSRWFCSWLAAATLFGCSWWKTMPPGGTSSASVRTSARIDQRSFAHRPQLVTLVRSGDPRAALVLALANSDPIEESTRLAALLSTRLQGLAPCLDVRSHVGGITVTVSVDTVASVKNLTRRLDDAVRRPIQASELNHPDYRKRLQQLQQQVAQAVSPAERALCVDVTHKNGPQGSDVERSRRSAFSEQRARWGIAGSAEYSEAMQLAVSELEAWPRHATPESPWPKQNVATFVPPRLSSARIDVVLRTPAARMAVAASREMQAFAGNSLETLATLPVAMHLDRVNVTPQMVGACLGLSLSQQPQGTPPTVDELILATRILVQEARRLATQSGRNATATLTAIEQTDPRRAAEIVTWLALSDDLSGESERFRVEVDVGAAPSTVPPTPEQRRALIEATTGTSTSMDLPLLRRAERGQGNLFALLASPCGTWDESSKTVGTTSLMLRTLALRHQVENHVTTQPWATADGIGIMAHARRLSADESPEQLAQRLGDALGRILVASKLDAGDLWQTRTDALQRLGPSPRPALWPGLLALSSRNPGLVLPDGTFSSVEAISLSAVRERRAEWLRLPLRLAVLENDEGDQSATVKQTLMRWLSVFRSDTTQCPRIEVQQWISPDEIQIASRLPDPDDAAVTITTALPVGESIDEGHAEMLEFLLGEQSGWLARRLRDDNIVGTVEAKVVGGLQRRGLVVAIGTTPSAADAATTTIRRLFQELGVGALPSPSSIAKATADLKALHSLKRLDPRVRLEDLWLSRVNAEGPSESSFRAYLNRAFSDVRLVTVRSTRTPAETDALGRGKR